MKERALLTRDDYGFQLFFPDWEFAKEMATAYGQHDGHAAYHPDYLHANLGSVITELDPGALEFVESYCKRTAAFLDEPCELSLYGRDYDQEGAQPYRVVSAGQDKQPRLKLHRVDTAEQN